jgi:hypothetical protein
MEQPNGPSYKATLMCPPRRTVSGITAMISVDGIGNTRLAAAPPGPVQGCLNSDLVHRETHLRSIWRRRSSGCVTSR